MEGGSLQTRPQPGRASQCNNMSVHEVQHAMPPPTPQPPASLRKRLSRGCYRVLYEPVHLFSALIIVFVVAAVALIPRATAQQTCNPSWMSSEAAAAWSMSPEAISAAYISGECLPHLQSRTNATNQGATTAPGYEVLRHTGHTPCRMLSKRCLTLPRHRNSTPHRNWSDQRSSGLLCFRCGDAGHHHS